MHEKSLKVIYALLLIIAIFLYAVPVSAGYTWVTKKISQDSVNALGGKISGDFIIYLGGAEGLDNSRNQIFLYNVQSGDQKVIGSHFENMTVAGPEISGDLAAWFETPVNGLHQNKTGTMENQILIYSLRNNSAEILESSGSAKWPKVDGDRLIWLADSGDGLNMSVFLYNRSTKEKREVCKLPIIDPADVLFRGDRIAYQNTRGLCLYSLGMETNTMVFHNTFRNESSTGLKEYAMCDDYLIYTAQCITFGGTNKGTSDELYLYIISKGETKRIDPVTGTFFESLQSGTEKGKNPVISSPFTDGKRIGWVCLDNTPWSTIVLSDPDTGEVEKIPLNGRASDISFYQDRMIWVESHFPSFHGELVYAFKVTGAGEVMQESVPGFTSVTGTLSLLFLLVFLAGRNK